VVVLTIAFRVDASLRIGTGHVMRCLTLAKALRERGAECLFLSRDHEGNLNEMLNSQGFDVSVLPADEEPPQHSGQPVPTHSDWLGVSWLTDAQQTIEALGHRIVDWLIVDHYALDSRWETRIRPNTRKLMVIDDLADREHDCDLLLDQNLVANFENRYDLLVPPGCTRLLGPKYALLQPEYAELRSRVPPRCSPVDRIFVYFGGSDIYGLTELTISAFLRLQHPDLKLDVVINSKSKNAKGVRAQVAGQANITLHENLPSLAPLMAKADLSIGASGATTWERCCLGLPSLVATVAENQTPIADSLDRLGLVLWIGSAHSLTALNIAQSMKKILKRSDLESWSRSCTQVVDGMGLRRVTSILALDRTTGLRARLATLADEELLLNWANEPEVENGAIKKTLISNSEHKVWFYSKLKNIDVCRIFIIETETGYPIGQVRFDNLSGDWRIRYSLSSIARGYGLEKKALIVAIKKLRNSETGAIVFGAFFFQNEKSKRIFDTLAIGKEAEGGTIAFCSDRDSWITDTVAKLIAQLLENGKRCCWAHNAQDLVDGDFCFYLSYGRLVSSQIRKKFKNNLVVHASDLPSGRGWSPASWLILERKTKIPVTLFEAVDEVDAGQIYDQRWFSVHKTDLIEDWQAKLAELTADLVLSFTKNYPEILLSAKLQQGDPSYYLKRKPKDSQLDLQKTILEQFELLQIASNENYPVYFEFLDTTFYIKIYKSEAGSSEKSV
jgi:UDP-2,4-diacetamido-2,4,6-trideoxy-beta-L-altropyranose hydrolase